jgi:hypothetical protein
MKNITLLKNKFEKENAQKYCNVSDVNKCPDPKKECTCAIAAETKAYLHTIIPEPFYKYSINDFDGRSKDDSEELIDARIALAAKKKVIEYCWESVSIENIGSISSIELDKKSIICKRKDECSNVVIHAGFSSGDDIRKGIFCPRGKTLIASIIMKEAINSRTRGGIYSSQTFDWIEFPILENMIKNKEDISVSDIRSADWLVVDDIPYSKYYAKNLLDPFFLERLSDGLPSIFVFKFDVKKIIEEDILGVAISKVIHDPKTFFIKLSS